MYTIQRGAPQTVVEGTRDGKPAVPPARPIGMISMIGVIGDSSRASDFRGLVNSSYPATLFLQREGKNLRAGRDGNVLNAVDFVGHRRGRLLREIKTESTEQKEESGETGGSKEQETAAGPIDGSRGHA